MVIIHDHACSTTVKLYGIYDSTKMPRSSSTTTRGDRLCDPSRAEQRGGADAAVRVGGDTLRRSCSTEAVPRRYRGQGW